MYSNFCLKFYIFVRANNFGKFYYIVIVRRHCGAVGVNSSIVSIGYVSIHVYMRSIVLTVRFIQAQYCYN